MKKRLFIAIELPQVVREKLKLAPISKLRTTSGQNLHITVLFLGYIEEKRIEKIKNIIKTIVEKITSFTLKFDSIIFAPPNKQIRMIWALFEKNTIYEKLNKQLAERLQDFKPDIYKDPLIHITLARFKKQFSKKDLEEIKLPEIEVEDFSVEKIALFESVLRGSGPIYTKLAEFPLRR